MSKTNAEKLLHFAKALIDQESASIIVEPKERAPGFWFGGGNGAIGPDGRLYIVGRYRNSGDSTTGLRKGERGLELTILRTEAPWDGRDLPTLEKVLTLTKEDLSRPGSTVVSIEGTALRFYSGGVELFLSSEKKEVPYPEGLEGFQKPGTGVWTIERLRASSVEELSSVPLEQVVTGRKPEKWHVKDPVLHEARNGATILLFCTHPFSWTSSNSAYAVRRPGREEEQPGEAFQKPVFDFFPRGSAWDVAVSRITDALDLSRIPGCGVPPETLLFYDGAECMREHEQNPNALQRPRGYSCEEIAGLAHFSGNDLRRVRRLTTTAPAFLSPWGTGSCRYIHTFLTEKAVVAIWQQARGDGSQPLVLRSLPTEEAVALLTE